jgi:AAA15 family ATPase/GTPase
MFINNNIKYYYELSYNSKKVINESLYFYPNGRKTLIFNRKKTTDYTFNRNKRIQKLIEKRTKNNVLYLSAAAQWNYEKAIDPFEWFNNNFKGIRSQNSSDIIKFTLESINKDKKFKKLVLKALKLADIGISDISGKVNKITSEDSNLDVPPELKSLISTGKLEYEEIKISTEHKLIKESGEEIKVLFDFGKDESEGTIRLFSLIGPWLHTLKNGNVLIVDEMEIKLHDKLIQFLIDLFHDPIQNNKRAQLIFSTHNTNLLDLDIFRRDQIWFTEKDYNYGFTNLYSLLEFHPRKDINLQRGYLAGKYGAVPFIKNNKVI